MSNTRADLERRYGSQTADLLEMRQGLLSREAHETRHGVTDIRDPRHAAFYAEHRREVEADPAVREFRARMGFETRTAAVPAAPQPRLTEDELHERTLRDALAALDREEADFNREMGL